LNWLLAHRKQERILEDFDEMLVEQNAQLPQGGAAAILAEHVALIADADGVVMEAGPADMNNDDLMD
jgi:hypothetical protein